MTDTARTTADLSAEAEAEGYKRETCGKCGTVFEAHIHFIRCDARPCPMQSTVYPRSLMDMVLGLNDTAKAEGAGT